MKTTSEGTHDAPPSLYKDLIPSLNVTRIKFISHQTSSRKPSTNVIMNPYAKLII